MKIYKPTEEAKSIIIFIHGFTGGIETWMDRGQPKSLISYLIKDEYLKDKFHYTFFNYNTTLKPKGFRLVRLLKKFGLNLEAKQNLPIEKLSKNLSTKISDRFEEYDKIIIVGHSLGGLVGKYYINSMLSKGKDHRINLFITLATPHLGAGIANVAHIVFKNPQLYDLTLVSTTIAELTQSWIRHDNLPQRVYFTALEDDVVKIGAAGLEKDEVTVKDTISNHTSIVDPKSKEDDVVVGLTKTLKDFYKGKLKDYNYIRNRLSRARIEEFSAQTNYKITNNLRDELKSIDEVVNNLIGKVVSPKHNDAKQDFKSNKIISSLAIMTVPIDAGLQVLKMIIPKLEKIYKEEGQIGTFHIRKAVSSSLFNLDSKEYSKKTIQNWGTSYARRYGNPDVRIRVTKSNGDEGPLDFKFIKNEIIPAIVEKCYDRPFEELKESMFINSSTVEMAEEIFEKVKSMGLYNMYIKTILNLAFDIATQPPQPWFVNEKYKKENIKYDLGRAKRHFDVINRLNENNSDEEICHSAVDCIDHICSAILTKYDFFIGAGRLTPLNNLINFLNISNLKSGNKVLWEITQMKKVEGDLNASDLSFQKLIRDLKKHRELLGDSLNNVSHLVASSKNLYEIGINLIKKESKAKKLIETLSISNEIQELRNGIKYLLTFIPRLKTFPSKDEFLIHYFQFSDTLFNHINNRIIVLPILSDSVLNDNISNLFKGKSPFSRRTNTCFIITNGELSKLKEQAKQIESTETDIYLYVFQISQFEGMVNEIDRAEYFLNLIEEYEKADNTG
jgi:hypothetical protein